MAGGDGAAGGAGVVEEAGPSRGRAPAGAADRDSPAVRSLMASLARDDVVFDGAGAPPDPPEAPAPAPGAPATSASLPHPQLALLQHQLQAQTQQAATQYAVLLQLQAQQRQLHARGATRQAPAPSAPVDPQALADLQRAQRAQKQNNAAQKRYRSRQKEKVNNLVKRSEDLEVENKALKLRVAQLEATNARLRDELASATSPRGPRREGAEPEAEAEAEAGR